MAKILVVDDDDAIGATIKAMLSGSNHHVVFESDPRRIMEAVSNDRFDLIISDVFMPEFDGLELVMKVMETNPSTKVLVMTGGSRLFPNHSRDLEDITNSATLFGASKVIHKPFRKTELIDAVDSLI